jgi:4-aminobutyrate--pyruvate transaminase
MKPNSLKARDIAYTLHPLTNLVEHKKNGPLVITRGQGVFIYDEDGKEYLDAGAGLWCVSLGYSEKRLSQAAARQMETLPYSHMFRNMSHDIGIELAEKIISLLPVPMSKVYFNSSGSEANDTADKLVWYYNNALDRPRKKKIISRIKAFHGSSIAAGSLTGIHKSQLDFDLPIPNIRHTDCPHYPRYAKPGESEEDFATRMVDNLDSLIQNEGPDTVAAFIAEPVMGTGGVVAPPKTYFDKIQAVLRKHDILFIVDEVMCGFGRTGKMFGTETFNLKPDIMTMSKALSASYLPISAVAVSEKLYAAFLRQSEKIGVFGHGYTYTAHPVCAAVALETLNIYEERDILGHIRSIVPRFWARLNRLSEHPLVGEVRGVGLLAGVELMKNKESRENFNPKEGIGALFVKQCLENGVMLRAIEDAIALSPPLVITAAELDRMFDGIAKAVDGVAAAIKKR